jgi:hypothetical protein
MASLPKKVSSRPITPPARPPTPEPVDEKESEFKIIKVIDILGYIAQYESRCYARKDMTGVGSEVELLRVILSGYSDVNECLNERDFKMFVLLCQLNADHRPPRSKETHKDWLFRQIETDYDLRIKASSQYFDIEQFLYGDDNQ